jgi:hypothetical protein
MMILLIAVKILMTLLMLILLAGNAYYFFLPVAKHWSNCRWNCCISYGNLGYLEEIKQ